MTNLTKLEQSKLWKIIPVIIQWCVVITGSVVTLIVFLETAFRLFDFLNFNGYEEILIMVAFWLYMLGCAHGSYEKSQIKADILEVMMKESAFKNFLRVLREILTVALSAVFTVWAFNLITYAIGVHTTTPVYRIPMTIGYASIFVGLLLSTFYFVVYGIDELISVKNGTHRKAAEEAAKTEGGASV